jgi:hypothetical protein
MDDTLLVISPKGEIIKSIKTTINSIFAANYLPKEEIFIVGGDSEKIGIINKDN